MNNSNLVPENYSSQIVICRDGIEISGNFISLERNFVEVDIVDPYFNLKKSLQKTGLASQYSPGFIHQRQETGERLLGEIYLTLEQLDRYIDRYSEYYQNHLKEKEVIESIDNQEIKESIFRKLDDYFFKDFQYLDYSQREILSSFISIYSEHGIKCYK